MRNLQILIAAIAFLFAMTLTSCEKTTEEIIPTETEKKVAILGFFKISDYLGGCTPGLGFCGTFWSYDEAANRALGEDEASGTTSIENDEIVVHLTENNFSENLKHQLTKELRFVVEKDYEISEDFMTRAYKNAGKDVPSEKMVIEKGAYDVEVIEYVEDSAGISIPIKITLKFKKFTLTIEFECC